MEILRRIIFITIIFFYSIYVHYLYALIGNTFYYVEGYNFNLAIPFYYSALTIIFSVIPAFFFNIRNSLPSNYVLTILYLIHIIPSIVFFPFCCKDINFNNLIWLIFISLSYASFILFYNILGNFRINMKRIYIKKMSKYLKPSRYYFLLFVMSLFALLYLFHTFKGFKNISIFHVYEIRHIYKENVDKLTAYFVINVGYILSPFLTIVAFEKKSLYGFIYLILGIILSLIIFTNTGFKSVAFMWVYVIFWFFVFKKFNISNLAFKVVFVFILSIWIINLIGFILNLDFLYLHWIRRLILSAGMNTTYFYDYITSNELYFLNNAPNVISLQYFGTNGSANTGLLGDGFTRYRYVGVFLNYLLLFFILKILDSLFLKLRDNNHKCIMIAMLFPISYALSYSKTSSILLTYGLILLIILMYGRLYFEHKNLPHFNRSSNI